MTRKHAAISDEALCGALNPRVLVVGFHPATPGWYLRTRRPPLTDFDAWYVARGIGQVEIDRRWVQYGKGDLVLIKPGQRFLEERADAADPFGNFFVHFLPFGADAPGGLSKALADRWPARLSMAHEARLGDLFGQLLEAYQLPSEGGPLRRKVLMLEILEIVLADLRRRAAPALPPAYPKLLRACEFIRRHHAEGVTLDAIAEHADLSASYLLTLFRHHVGCSPMQYRIRQQLQAARPLLAAGRSVTATARAVGFESLHYFSRTFRAQTGITPRAFAEQCRRK
jgi:AraC-like DNA-binding protein